MNNEATTNQATPEGETMNNKTLEARLEIDGKETDEFFMNEYELTEAPEDTARDLADAISCTLNGAGENATATVTLQDPYSEAPKMTFTFRNGGRGWGHRQLLESWILTSFGLLDESDAKHGPISTPENRDAAKGRDARRADPR